MKKVLIFILAVVLSFSVFAMVACQQPCETHLDGNHDGICDICDTEGLTVTHTDSNHDGKCDAGCGATVEVNDLVMNGGGGIYVVQGSNVTVNNVTLKADYSASSRHLFYVNNSTLTVNSGVFEVLRTSSSYFVLDGGAKAYVKGGTFEDMMNDYTRVNLLGGSTLEISGGSFNVKYPNRQFDPTPYLAAGYKAERVGDYMVVSAE